MKDETIAKIARGRVYCLLALRRRLSGSRRSRICDAALAGRHDGHSGSADTVQEQSPRRKFAEHLVEGKIKPETFEEWNRSTGSKERPERVKAKKSARRKKRGNAKREKRGRLSR